MSDPVRHVRPRSHEVAVVHHPDGAPVRVHTAAGPRDLKPMLDGEPLVATVPGDAGHLGWVAPVQRYSQLRAVRNHRHPADRGQWDDAVKVVKGGGVAYVSFERLDYHGRQRWTATDVRFHADNPRYHVRFARIGRNHEPPDLEVGPFDTGDPAVIWDVLGDEINRHALRNGLGSRDTDVLFDPDTMRGSVTVGGFRNAGNFLVTESGADLATVIAALDVA